MYKLYEWIDGIGFYVDDSDKIFLDLDQNGKHWTCGLIHIKR